MKRTISLVIAIAVMISMFIVPVSAADYVVDMSTLEAYNFSAAGINDIVGFHYATGGQEGNNSLGTLDLSGYDYMKITYSNGVAASNTDIKDIVLVNGAGDEIGTLDTVGTGWWGTFVNGYIDISAVTSTSDTYTLKANPEVGGNGIWVTGVTLTNEIAIEYASQISAGETKLTQDITGALSVSEGTYVIDLAGHTWSHDNVVLTVGGTANVTVKDSVGGGLIDSPHNDAITVDGGSLTLENIKVSADSGGMDAVFVNGGTVYVKDSTLVGSKACMDLSQYVTSAPSVTVENTTFEVYNGSEDKSRICAFEFRNNLTTVKLVGDNKFENSTVLLRDDCTKAVADLFTYGDSASATFSAAGALIQSRWTPYTINYTYTAPVSDPAFVGGTLEITNGIALDFVVSNATDTTVVKVGDVELASYVDGSNTFFVLDGFGPHTMGDVHVAELYVDGELVDTIEYSVKEYCLAVIESTEASDAHKTLAKAVLNYGAKAQVYADYNVENLVNNGIVFDGSYDPAEDVALILNDFAGASANWVNANVKFGDTVELIINLEGEADNVDVTIGTDTVNYEVLTTAAGTKYIVVTEITPDQFKDSIAAVAYNGDVRVSKTLTYSVGSYISDRVENSTNEAYVELVKALSIYGDAVAAFVA